MSDSSSLTVQPEVRDFVARVRARLGDLTEEEREELVGGLEADLSERLEDVGPGGLGDPVAYAAELRAAAGLDARGRRSGLVSRIRARPVHEEVDALLEAARLRWETLVSSHGWAARVWDTVVAMRPVWWALRAWVAVQLLDATLGPYEYPTVIPALGAPFLGPMVLLGAVWVSVELGRARLRLPNRLLAWTRVALVGINLFAVMLLAVQLSRFPGARDSHAFANGEFTAQVLGPRPSGLEMDGRVVRNVFAYDATGRPLTAVQLYDAKGRPLTVTRDPYQRSYRQDGATVWTYPWFNGSQPLLNVFPLPVRRQPSAVVSRTAWDSPRPPELPPAPLAVVPRVALPTPSGAEAAGPSAGPSAESSADPSANPSARRSSRPSGYPSRARSTGPSGRQ
jgi:hypothetical protein